MKLNIANEEYDIIDNPDGTQSLSIKKNKEGFRVKLNFSNNEEANNIAEDEMNQFIIKQITQGIIKNQRMGL